MDAIDTVTTAGNPPSVYINSLNILSVMIIDPRVFEDIYLPRELIHRESEVSQLSRAFQPALDGSAPHNGNVQIS